MNELLPEIVKVVGILFGGGVAGEIIRRLFATEEARTVDRAKINAELWERLDKQDDELDALRKDYWELHKKNLECESKTERLQGEVDRLNRRLERYENQNPIQSSNER